MGTEKVRSWIKDAIYIFLFIAAVVGYFIDKSSSDATESAAIKSNTEDIQELNETIGDVNDNMIENAKFQGKVLQYIEMNEAEKNRNPQ